MVKGADGLEVNDKECMETRKMFKRERDEDELKPAALYKPVASRSWGKVGAKLAISKAA